MYFGHFLAFEGIFGNFKVSEVFRSFLRFRGYFGHFLGLGSILVIFWGFLGILVIDRKSVV